MFPNPAPQAGAAADWRSATGAAETLLGKRKDFGKSQAGPRPAAHREAGPASASSRKKDQTPVMSKAGHKLLF